MQRSHILSCVIIIGPLMWSVRLTCARVVAVTVILAAFGLAPSLLIRQTVAQLAESAKEKAKQTAGLPDYTEMTGYLEHAALPEERPEVLWVLSEINIRGQENATDVTITMTDLTDAVVGDGVVYFCTRGAPGNVFAVSAVDGSQVWQHRHKAAGITAAPAIDKEFIYFGSEAGLTALRRDNGAIVWVHEMRQGAGGGSPIPVGDRVYLSSYDGNAYAFSRSDGRVIWKKSFTKDAPHDRPGFPGERARFRDIAARPRGAACDGELFVQSVFDQSRVIALDCATGARRWSFEAEGWVGPAPTIAGDRVYISSQDKHLYSLDRRSGEVVWKFVAPTWLSSRVAVHKDKVFLPVHGGRLYQLDIRSGDVLRLFTPEEEGDRKTLVYSFPIITDHIAYFTTGEGQLYAIDIATSQLRWKLRPSASSELFTHPATDGQRIFLTCRQDGDKSGEAGLIAVGLEP